MTAKLVVTEVTLKSFWGHPKCTKQWSYRLYESDRGQCKSALYLTSTLNLWTIQILRLSPSIPNTYQQFSESKRSCQVSNMTMQERKPRVLRITSTII
ncbi:hypothetical protein FOVG_19859 [Fusarium oxysporum f. sp. pisi HDV247]|uniref:Uncharacterized protein n=1 Tax=Fusarium oxysporum f. sp. pisi HDV247 TaxID=1080344 RepID=W9NEZ5_FUSOX|nr:hypothetical protein FOVG_19859 [Fusarium oxysporum f. sp. pisi HDV247]